MFYSYISLFFLTVANALFPNPVGNIATILDQSVFVMKIIHVPHYHISAPNGWLNDPSAFISYKGRFHIFYQTHPLERAKGPSQWGHVISKNLVDWYHYPSAIGPNSDYDRDGCLSGSAIIHNGYLALFYTGHLRGGDMNQQTQNIAVSKDGVQFQKYTYNPIIYERRNGSGEFRHPKVWRHLDKWYMIVASQTPDRDGCLMLYSSPDLINWYYKGMPAQSLGDMGFMWENPDLLEIDGSNVLIVSVQGFVADGYRNIYHTVYIVCDFNYTTLQFENFELSQDTYNYLDYGHDFYGAQTTIAPDGTRLLVAWLGSWGSYYGGFEDGYSSQMTMIREISLSRNGRLLMVPARQYAELRSERLEEGWFNPGDKFRSYARAYEMIVNASSVDKTIIVKFQWRKHKHFKLSYLADSRRIIVDRGGVDGIRSAYWHPKELNLRIFVDISSAEVYCSDGELVFSTRIYPRGKVSVSFGGNQQVHIVQYKLRKSIKYYPGTDFSSYFR